MEHYDVIIIGAGLAGLHCARLLNSFDFSEGNQATAIRCGIHTRKLVARHIADQSDLITMKPTSRVPSNAAQTLKGVL